MSPLTEEESSALKQSIVKYGVRNALVVWKNGKNYLIDGFGRWEIIQKHNIPEYKVIKLHFENRHEVINWIIDNQLGRRNCTPEAKSYLRGLRYRNEKQNRGGDRKSSGNSCHSKTENVLAKAYKVSPRTIRNDEEFTDAVDTIIKLYPKPKKQSEVKQAILSRKVDLTKKDILGLSTFGSKLIRDVISGRKEFWQARSEHNKNKKAKRLEKAAKLSMPEDIKLYVGDSLDLSDKHIKNDSIDCIMTDPPYSKDALECFDKLGQIAKRVLKPGGFCCFYTGKMFLADVMRIMDKYLDYYWQIVLLHHGGNSRVFNPQAVHATRINEFYKPILIFQKPPKKKQDEYCDDVIQGSGAEKSLHPWQQSERELHSIVEKFSGIGETVLDPFCGAGTTGVVCKKMGRKFIGFDIDPDCIKETKIRIRNVVNVETAIKAKKKKTIQSKVKFYQGDCRIVIPKHDLLSKAHIAIFDPPYNQKFKYDEYKDNMPRDEYIKMLSMFKDFPCCIVHYPEQSMSLVYEAMRKEPKKVIGWAYKSNLSKNYRLISCYNCQPDFSKSPQPYDAPYDRRVQQSVLDGRLKPLGDWWDDIGFVNNVSKEKTEHPCQVPVALCQRLLAILTDEGQTVLDPFSGSGSMAVACKKSGRDFIGVELSKHYIDIAKKRVKKA